MSEWVITREIKKAFMFHDLKLDVEYDVFSLTGSYVWRNIGVLFNIDSYEIPLNVSSFNVSITPNKANAEGLIIWGYPKYTNNTTTKVDMKVDYSIRGGRYVKFYVVGTTFVSKSSVRISCFFTEVD